MTEQASHAEGSLPLEGELARWVGLEPTVSDRGSGPETADGPETDSFSPTPLRPNPLTSSDPCTCGRAGRIHTLSGCEGLQLDGPCQCQGFTAAYRPRAIALAPPVFYPRSTGRRTWGTHERRRRLTAGTLAPASLAISAAYGALGAGYVLLGLYALGIFRP